MNIALDGEGPFSTERAGTIPAGQLVEMCFSGKYSRQHIMKMIQGRGGMTAYLGINDMITISAEAEKGEEPHNTLLNAMLYTIAKQIGAMFVALDAFVDAIILTGGIAHSNYCMTILRQRVERLAPVFILPGENEIESLAFNAFGVLNGKIKVKEYC